MAITTIIFDLDGLLLDAESVWGAIHPQFLAKYHIEEDEILRQRSFGTGVQDMVRMYQDHKGLRGDVSALAQEYREMFYEELQNGDGFREMPGATDFVEKVKQAGYTVALATGGHTTRTVEEILRNFGIIEHFSAIVSSDMVKRGKPDPEVYLYTAEKLHVAPGQCLVFEDSPNGVMAGKAAGMRVVGVNPDEKIRTDLESAGADVVVASLSKVDLKSVVGYNEARA